MTRFTEPSEDDLRPLLKAARNVRVRAGEPNPPKAVALFDPETGEMIAGPKTIQAHSRVQWSQDGIEVGGNGAFCSYDDLKESWRFNARERERFEQQTSE